MYVILNTSGLNGRNGRYIAQGGKSAFTPYLHEAKRYPSLEAARLACCANEKPVMRPSYPSGHPLDRRACAFSERRFN